MIASSLTRTTRAVLAAVLTAGLAATSVLPASTADAGPALRRNPTGTAAGSAENGAGNLKLSLTMLTDGRVKVSWVRPTRVQNIRKFVVKIGPNRMLDSKVRSYNVGRTKQSAVVSPAFGATKYSGNYTFVKVIMVRTDRKQGSSPTKWIQAPIGAACTASLANRVTVGTFNVRSWDVDIKEDTPRWNVREDKVIDQILSSGARVIGLQEASGHANLGFGSERQWQRIIDELNAAEPASDWRDAVGNLAYGIAAGMVGTRVIYDATAFDRLDYGLKRLPIPGTSVGEALLPWARFQAVGATQPAFVFATTHLRTGESAGAFSIRAQQLAHVIPFLAGLRQSYSGDQVILTGDMNSTVNTKPYNGVQYSLLNAGYYDAFATTALTNPQFGTTNGFKFPVRATPHRRDYVMTLGPVKGSCGLVNRAYHTASQLASDHFMQVATLPLATS